MTLEKRISDLAEVKCRACGWLGKCDDVLTGDHPFQKGCHVYGCPECGEIEGFEQILPNAEISGQLNRKTKEKSDGTERYV